MIFTDMCLIIFVVECAPAEQQGAEDQAHGLQQGEGAWQLVGGAQCREAELGVGVELLQGRVLVTWCRVSISTSNISLSL